MKYTFDDPASLSSPARPALSARLARFLGLLASLFVISVGIVVTRRLSEDSLALLLGLACGITATFPTLVLLFLSWRREVSRRSSPLTQSPHASPPVIVVSPPALPYGAQNSHSAYTYHQVQGWPQPQQSRTFEIIGDEG